MDVSETVAARRSIRAFLDKPVDKDALLRVLDKARRAPSGGNVQPWHAAAVVSETMESGESTPEYDIYRSGMPEPYKVN